MASTHNVDTLKDMMDANERLATERDRRYQERFQAQEKAVELAQGRVSIVSVVAIAGLILAVWEKLK